MVADAERNDFVGDQQNAVRAGDLAEPPEEAILRIEKARSVRQRVDDDRGKLRGVLAHGALDGIGIIKWKLEVAEVVRAVVAAFKADDLAPAGEGARRLDGHHYRFGT